MAQIVIHIEQVLTLLGNELVISSNTKKYRDLPQLVAFQSITTPEGDEIVPLPADHVEGALLLRITRRQTSMREDQTLFITPESVHRITALIEKCKLQCGLSRAVSLGAEPKCLLR